MNYYVLKTGTLEGDGLTPATAFRLPTQAYGKTVMGDTVFIGPQWNSSDVAYYASQTNVPWQTYVEKVEEVKHEEVKAEGQGQAEGVLKAPFEKKGKRVK